MPRQTQKTKSTQTKETEPVEAPAAKESKSAEQLKAESDDLLDEIDRLLEESEVQADQFIQKGGQVIRVIIDTISRPLHSLRLAV